MLAIPSPVTLGRRELAPRKKINNRTFFGKSSESSTAPTILDQVIEVLQCTHAPYVMPPSTRVQAAQSTTFRNDPSIPFYNETYHKLTKDPATWQPAKFDLSSLWVWNIVKSDEIPHNRRFELWPDVFHSKNFLQTK